MLPVEIVCVGKLREAFWRSACEEYRKRLSAYARLRITELREASFPKDPVPPALVRKGLAEEAVPMARLLGDGLNVALCVEGTPLDSVAFARRCLEEPARRGGVRFFIGGSYGLDEAFKRRCGLRLSFSELTFPHQLMRVILLEQLYRGFRILEGSAYHK